MEQTLITADEVRLLSALVHANATAREPASRSAIMPTGASGASGVSGAAPAPAGPPGEVVASMNTAVDYVELPAGLRRTVVLVHPAGADAGIGRVSVLSPVGRALLGCAPGDHAEVRLPSGQPLRLFVADVRPEARDG